LVVPILSSLPVRHSIMKKYLSATTLVMSCLLAGTNVCQAQNANQNSSIGSNSNGNTIPQNSQQTSIVYPNIPLNPVIQNPINTENDFGINFGGGINTLDGRNMTLYLGVTYQPGRTDDHNVRMAKLRSETQLLEFQKQSTQTQLELLKQQVAEQEIRLKKIQPSEQVTPKSK
jgi:hypothetical protein